MRYEVTTGLTLPEALEQAAAYFGPGGVGLQAITQTPHSLVFQGGGGHVALTVHPGTPTTLELETREWDVAVQKFMGQVSHRPHWWSRWWRRKRPVAPPAPVFPILNNASEEWAGRARVLGTGEPRRNRPKPGITVGTLLIAPVSLDGVSRGRRIVVWTMPAHR